MKLTDPDIIKEGEKDLIDAIKDDLDLSVINEIVKDKLKAKNIESKGGKIIVHNNQVAFQIEFELSLSGSLIFDRHGNFITEDEVNTVPDKAAKEKPEEKAVEDEIEDEVEEEDSEVKTEEDTDKEEEVDKTEEDKDKTEDKKDDSEVKAEEIAQQLVAEDDLSDDSDEEMSELDLDIDGFEDIGEDDIDFSNDEEIGDILQESREFWEKKKES